MLEMLKRMHDKAIEQSELSESKYLEIESLYGHNVDLVATYRQLAAEDRHYAKGIFDAMKAVWEYSMEG